MDLTTISKDIKEAKEKVKKEISIARGQLVFKIIFNVGFKPIKYYNHYNNYNVDHYNENHHCIICNHSGSYETYNVKIKSADRLCVNCIGKINTEIRKQINMLVKTYFFINIIIPHENILTHIFNLFVKKYK